MVIETNRLLIKEFSLDMAKDVHLNSLDEDNRRFVPDEVFETEEDAKEVIEFLISRYNSLDGPLVYPIFIKETNQNIGYVQLIKLEDEYEIGYHIAKKYTKNGYATEALSAFLPAITKKLGIKEVLGICLNDNIASFHVLTKCGFKKIFEGIDLYQGEEREVIKTIKTLK